MDDALLVEYQTAQDSAQHHDNMIWSATSIVWAASLVLLGFVLENFEKKLNLIIMAVAVLAMVMLGYIWYASRVFGAVKNQKYARCKKIEQLLGLQQHASVRMPKHVQRVLYGIVMGLFIATWFGILIYTIIKCLRGTT